MGIPNKIVFGGMNACLDVDDQVAAMLRTLYPESRWPFRDRRHSEGLQGSTLKTNRDPWLESPYPLDPVPGINEVIIPTGASRYGKALLLVDGDSYQDLVWKGYVWGVQQSEGLLGKEQLFDRLIVEFSNTITRFIWPMTALTPVRVGREFEKVINPEADTDFSLWLLPLVDARYFLQRKLRKIEFTDGVDMTWSDLFSELSEQAGPEINVWGPDDFDSGNPVEISAEYLVPDRDTFSSQGIGLGHAIDAAALSLGMRVVPSGSIDALSLHIRTADYARKRLFGSYFGSDKSASISEFPRELQAGGIYPRAPKPGALDLVSPVLRNYYVCEGHQVTSAEIEESENDKERITVFSTLYAQYLDEYITGESSSQLYNLANKLRDDLAEWAKWSHNGTFAGTPAVDLTGYDDYLSIGFRGGRVINTQIRPLPQDFYPRIQLSQAPAFFRHLDDGIICRLLGDVTACDPETLRMGYGQARPLLPSPSGYLEERKRSDDTEIEIKVWNASFEPLVHDGSEGALPQIIQCKKLNCLPVIDVEYCPPE